LYSAATITVYQAYPPEIASAAVAAGRLVPPFKRARMTWIKPSFLWMMYRCGWMDKPGQERVLAIEVSRVGFEWALAHACLSSYERSRYGSRDEWSLRRRVDVAITDATSSARRIRDLIRAGDEQGAAALLPAGRPYPLSVGISTAIQASPAIAP
jgi:hypothetical protein